TPFEAFVIISSRSERDPGGPRLVGKRRIRDDVVVSAKTLAVLELRRGEGVAREDVGRWEVVQDHVHPREASRGNVFLLSFEGDMSARFGGDFQQKRSGAAGWVVGGRRRDRVG